MLLRFTEIEYLLKQILITQQNLSSIRLPFRSSMVSGVSTPVRTPEVIPDGVAKLKRKISITLSESLVSEIYIVAQECNTDRSFIELDYLH